MIPSISLRLDNLIKAMEMVIIPSIEKAAPLAQEQASLLVKHLKIINDQWDTAYRFEKGSLHQMINLAKSLIKEAEGGEKSLEARDMLTAVLNEMDEKTLVTSEATTNKIIDIGNKVEELIDASFEDGSTNFKLFLLSSVLEYGKDQSFRERVWFKGAGMDPDYRELKDIEEILSPTL